VAPQTQKIYVGLVEGTTLATNENPKDKKLHKKKTENGTPGAQKKEGGEENAGHTKKKKEGKKKMEIISRGKSQNKTRKEGKKKEKREKKRDPWGTQNSWKKRANDNLTRTEKKCKKHKKTRTKKHTTGTGHREHNKNIRKQGLGGGAGGDQNTTQRNKGGKEPGGHNKPTSKRKPWTNMGKRKNKNDIHLKKGSTHAQTNHGTMTQKEKQKANLHPT